MNLDDFSLDKIHPLKEVTSDFRGSPTSATAFPVAETFSEKWFDEWLKHDNAEEYLKCDTRTDEGRLQVARFNGYKKEWTKVNDTFPEGTSVQKRFTKHLFFCTLTISLT